MWADLENGYLNFVLPQLILLRRYVSRIKRMWIEWSPVIYNFKFKEGFQQTFFWFQQSYCFSLTSFQNN